MTWTLRDEGRGGSRGFGVTSVSGPLTLIMATIGLAAALAVWNTMVRLAERVAERTRALEPANEARQSEREVRDSGIGPYPQSCLFNARELQRRRRGVKFSAATRCVV